MTGIRDGGSLASEQRWRKPGLADRLGQPPSEGDLLKDWVIGQQLVDS
jgi:hypothetical protein